MTSNHGNAQQRLFESDITPVTASIPFNGRTYEMNIQLTAFGGFADKMIDFVSILTGTTTAAKPTALAQSASSYDHFRKLVARCPDLKHKNEQLRDHIQVCKTNFPFYYHSLTST